MGKLLEELRTETRPAANPANPANSGKCEAQTGAKISRLARLAPPLVSSDEAAKAEPCDAIGLRARCREACRGLPVSPADLLASLNEADKAAQLSGEEGPELLRTAAECMAERAKPGLSADIERAYQRCRDDLRKHPEWHKAIWTVDPDADPVLLAVAVRGIGCATLRIDRERYAGREFELLELIARVDTEGRRVPVEDGAEQEAAG